MSIARSLAALSAALLALASGAAMATERILEAPGPLGALQGTLLSPPQKAPVVVIVPGSGPTDRDGNNTLGVTAATYRLLAEGLEQKGIASLRIDKRGMFGSRRAISDPNAVTMADYAADAQTWAAKARAEAGVDCAWIAGHSEGGIVALASAPGRDICGIILIATPGRPFGDILREQLRSNPANAPILEQALTAIATLEQGGAADESKLHPALLPLFDPSVQGFLKDAMSYDPAKLIAAIDKPVLIVQGARDIQVSEADAQRLKAANPRAELALLPDVNHVLKVVPSGDRSKNLASYADASLPVAGSVVDAIATFIENHRSR